MRLRPALWILMILSGVLSTGGSALADLPLHMQENAPVRVWDLSGLGFGDVLPGVNHRVDIVDAGAGRWFVWGNAGAEVEIAFIGLPSALDDAGNSMPVFYGPGSAGHHTRNRARDAVRFDPANVVRTRLSNPFGFMFVWIGGTAAPTTWQASGTYDADITIDVNYTGN